MSENLKVYHFSVSDVDAEYLTFGCVAKSPQDAWDQASAAGFHSVHLLEIRNLKIDEEEFFINNAILKSPVLGHEWFPLIESIDAATKSIRPGGRISFDFMARKYGFSQPDSPYFQGVFRGDGSLFIELGSPQLIEQIGNEGRSVISYYGWEPPFPGEFPNYTRTFQPGWNIRHVSFIVLETAVAAFGVTSEDLFLVEGTGILNLNVLGKLDALNQENGRMVFGEAFGIPGLHAFSQPKVNVVPECLREMNQVLDSAQLATIDVPESLSSRIQVQEWNFRTDDSFDSGDDYFIFEQRMDRLAGQIKDTFSISHGGHGINSWALTLHFVYGDFAISAQAAYGGVYENSAQNRKAWEIIARFVNSLIRSCDAQSHSEDASTSYRHRPIQIEIDGYRSRTISSSLVLQHAEVERIRHVQELFSNLAKDLHEVWNNPPEPEPFDDDPHPVLWFPQLEGLFARLDSAGLIADYQINPEPPHGFAFVGHAVGGLLAEGGAKDAPMFDVNAAIRYPAIHGDWSDIVRNESSKSDSIGAIAGGNWIVWLDATSGLQNVDSGLLDRFISALRGGEIIWSNL